MSTARKASICAACSVPARQSSCPAFVGPDLSRLLVTSAWQGMDEAARAADPDHGRTFVLDVAARGRAGARCQACKLMEEADSAKSAHDDLSFKNRDRGLTIDN